MYKFTLSLNRMLKNSFLGGLFFLFMPTYAFAIDLAVKSNGTAQFNGKTYPCLLGKNGVTSHKMEGDLKTPLGKFPLRCVYYRPDKFPQGIYAKLPQKLLNPNLGWCDDPTSERYNQAVTLPFSGRCEHLWRNDDVYDLIVIIGYNDQDIQKNKGSAIFIHVANPDCHFTRGCIAFSQKDLLTILKKLDKKSSVVIS